MSGLKPHSWIEDLPIYVGGKSKALGAKPPVKLSSNESPIGASPKAKEAFLKASETLFRYPDASYSELREALAQRYGLDADRIICGNGSDEILKLVVKAFAGPGDEVLYSRYGFMMYPLAAQSVGATPIEIEDKDYTADVDAILEAVSDDTRVIFLANPNNPTGTILMRDDLVRLAEGLPDHVVLVIDSAYAEFVEDEAYSSGADLVEQYDNILMTRTFSKIYGLAALRLGWGYGSATIMDALGRVRDPFNVTNPSQAAGVAAILDKEFEDKAREHNTQWRDWLTGSLGQMGLRVIPSAANFILVEFPEGDKCADNANAWLLENGYIVRHLPDQGLGSFLRITIGTEEQTQEVAELIRQFLEQ